MYLEISAVFSQPNFGGTEKIDWGDRKVSQDEALMSLISTIFGAILGNKTL